MSAGLDLRAVSDRHPAESSSDTYEDRGHIAGTLAVILARIERENGDAKRIQAGLQHMKEWATGGVVNVSWVAVKAMASALITDPSYREKQGLV